MVAEVMSRPVARALVSHGLCDFRSASRSFNQLRSCFSEKGIVGYPEEAPWSCLPSELAHETFKPDWVFIFVALRSFSCGSSGGRDDLKPYYLLDCVIGSMGHVEDYCLQSALVILIAIFLDCGVPSILAKWYLIVSNVPALGCGDELGKLFSSYGDIEECKPMDDEDCEPFTDVYWIKFHQANNARFAKRKLNEFVFLGNRLQVSYAPQYESLADAKDKLEGRRKEVLARLNPRRSGGSAIQKPSNLKDPLSVVSLPQNNTVSQQWNVGESQISSHSAISRVTTDQDYFPSKSMNQTVHLVREKLNKIQSSSVATEAGTSKKPRVDNRRRI